VARELLYQEDAGGPGRTKRTEYGRMIRWLLRRRLIGFTAGLLAGYVARSEIARRRYRPSPAAEDRLRALMAAAGEGEIGDPPEHDRGAS
jgi:hypothetical protein